MYNAVAMMSIPLQDCTQFCRTLDEGRVRDDGEFGGVVVFVGVADVEFAVVFDGVGVAETGLWT